MNRPFAHINMNPQPKTLPEPVKPKRKRRTKKVVKKVEVNQDREFKPLVPPNPKEVWDTYMRNKYSR